jgi:hypothetical protein
MSLCVTAKNSRDINAKMEPQKHKNHLSCCVKNCWVTISQPSMRCLKTVSIAGHRQLTLISATPLVPRRCSTSQSNLLMKSLASFESFASSGNFRCVLQLTIYHRTSTLSIAVFTHMLDITSMSNNVPIFRCTH